MSFRFAFIMLAGLVLAGCTPKNKVKEDVPPPPPPTEWKTQSEAVPDTLDYDFLGEAVAESFGESSEAEADLPVIEEVEKEEPIWTIPESRPAPKAAPGLYWVQIFATRNLDRAEQIAGEARDRLSHSIEIHFLDPYYKVLVGGFGEREEAVDLRDRLVNKGYRDAWIFEL